MPPSLMHPSETPSRVVIYVRLSQDQRGTEQGVDRQIEECLEYAAANGFEVVGEPYVDNDLSATKANVVRPEFERLLREVPGTGLHVLCWYTDRFIRTMRDLERVIASGLTVYGKYSDRLDLSTPAGRAVARTLTAWATFEGEQKAERQKAAHRQRVRSGRPFLGGARPFGFDKVNGTYAVNEVEANLLRQAYKDVIAGIGTTDVAAWLRLMTGTETWTFNSVRQVMLHPRNAGILTYNGEEIGPGNWEGIVPEATYRAAVRILTDPSRRTPGPRQGRGGIVHYLIGLAVCSKCEGPTKGAKHPTYYSYQCRRGCASARAEWLETKAAALIIQRLQEPLALVGDAASSPVTEGVRGELDALRTQVEEYEAAHESGQLTLAQFLKFNTTAQARIAELERQVATTVLDARLVDLIGREDIATHWLTELTARDRANIARSFFSRIEVLPRGRAETGKVHGRARFWIKGQAEPVVA